MKCSIERPSLDFALLPCRTKSGITFGNWKVRQNNGVWIKILNWVRQRKRQALPCYTTLTRQWFRRRSLQCQTKYINYIKLFWWDCAPTQSHEEIYCDHFSKSWIWYDFGKTYEKNLIAIRHGKSTTSGLGLENVHTRSLRAFVILASLPLACFYKLFKIKNSLIIKFYFVVLSRSLA